MGNCCQVEGAVDHWIYVKTGDRKNSKRTAKVKIHLVDNKGTRSVEIPLDVFPSQDLEKGKTDVYQAPPLGHDYGEVVNIELWREDQGDADWFCEVIVLNDRRTEKCFYFPVNRWLKPGRHYKIQANDVSLPQTDPNNEDRKRELQEIRAEYKYGQRAPDLPVQVSTRVISSSHHVNTKHLYTIYTMLGSQYFTNVLCLPGCIQPHRKKH